MEYRLRGFGYAHCAFFIFQFEESIQYGVGLVGWSVSKLTCSPSRMRLTLTNAPNPHECA
jgi:hypothetical protein